MFPQTPPFVDNDDSVVNRIMADWLNTVNDALSLSRTWSVAQRMAYTQIYSLSASIAIDLSTSNHYFHVLTESTTLAAPSNNVAGQSGVIEFVQDAGTARTLAFNSFWKWPLSAPKTISVTLGSVNIMYYVVSRDGTFATCTLQAEVS